MDAMKTWSCPQCSFANHPELPVCEMCEFDQRSSRKTRSPIVPQERSPRPPNAHAKVSPHDRVDGLIELITEQGRNNPKLCYELCAPPCSFYTQKGSYGAAWSCGYRNIQMLCSSLMQNEVYRRVLFHGDGEIPDIRGLQGWVEQAWKDGFDPEGAMQLGGELIGTKTWIGATECAALLRFFGVRAVIVDFPGPDSAVLLESQSQTQSQTQSQPGVASTGKRPAAALEGIDGPGSMSERICRWVERYFRSGSEAEGADEGPGEGRAVDGAGGGEGSQPREEAGHRQSAGRRFRPPLYFQHQGHSRSITGLHYNILPDGGRELVNLIIFNPSCDPAIAQASLTAGTQRWRTQLCKHKSSYTEDDYQLVYVAPGIMAQEERERSKRLIGMNENAPLAREIS